LKPDAQLGAATDALTRKLAATAALTAEFPSNANKAAEHGHDNALAPPVGARAEPLDASVLGSTLTERNSSPKLGKAPPEPGASPGSGPLERVGVNPAGQMLTANQGVRISDNQNSLEAGLRGPSLLEDFVLREKITHFDHERIPERIVHARGSAALGQHRHFARQTDPPRI
jgi:catalase